MSNNLNWLWTACRRARDTEWSDFCDSGGGRAASRAEDVLDIMWKGALERRNVSGYGTPRYDSMATLSRALDSPRRAMGHASESCLDRGKYADDVGASGAFHLQAKFRFMLACPAVVGAARFWPKDFYSLAAEALAQTAQRRVP